MSKYTELMLKYSDGELELKEAFQVEKMIFENQDLKKEYVLNQYIDEFMHIQQMMKQIQNDPKLSDIESITKDAVNEYFIAESEQEHGIAFFINGALLQDKELGMLIDDAEREMHLSGIEHETFKWVQRWKEQEKDRNEQDKYTREIIDFVKSGMNAGSKPEINILGSNTKTPKRRLMRLSAVAAILIFALGLWGIFSSKSDSKQLFADYYKPYMVIDGQTRSQEQLINEKFKEGIKLYKNGNFTDAGLYFNELLHLDKSELKIQLLYGITQIEEQNYEHAIFSFKEIIKTNGEYLIEAKWYLALCYLKTQDIKLAKELLTELSEVPGFYMAKSLELLEEL